jgi:uncharacterized protein (TIGR03437 family)
MRYAILLAVLACAQAQDIRYRYDAGGRLVRAELGPGRAISYTYNPAGDMIRRVVESGAAQGFVSVSSASYEAGRPLAPEMIAAGFGAGLASGTAANTQPVPPVELLGTSVEVTDSAGVTRRAQLFVVSPTQVNWLVPAGTARGRATVTVRPASGAAVSGAADIAAISPGVYAANARGNGVAAAFSLKVSAAGEQSQAYIYNPNTLVPTPVDWSPGEQLYLLLFGTGIRGFTQQVTATVAGETVPVLGAVPQGQYPGLDQINIGPLPDSLRGRGESPIVLRVDGQATNPVTVLLRAP